MTKPERIDAVIGERVRALREHLGIKQHQIASRNGWTQGTLSRLELGKGSWRVSQLIACGKAMKVHPSLLLLDLTPQFIAEQEGLDGG